jgi:hypothetical protein
MQTKRASGKRSHVALKKVSGQLLSQKLATTAFQLGFEAGYEKKLIKRIAYHRKQYWAQIAPKHVEMADIGDDITALLIELKEWQSSSPCVHVAQKRVPVLLPKMSVEEAAALSKKMFSLSLSDMQEELYDDAE